MTKVQGITTHNGILCSPPNNQILKEHLFIWEAVHSMTTEKTQETYDFTFVNKKDKKVYQLLTVSNF